MSSPARLPTIREIAKASGFSIYTVSYALRNNPRASAEAREKIQKVADRLGWRPNPLVTAYMSHFRSTREAHYQASLGFLVSNADGEVDALPEYQHRFYQGALQRAGELGYSLQPIWLHEPGLTSVRLNQILRSRGITGLIIPSFVKPTNILDGLDWPGFATVTSGYTLREPLHRVSIHLIHGVHLMLRRVLELGYHKIAVIFSKNVDERMDHGVFYPVYFEQKQRRNSRDEWIHHFSYAFPAPITTLRRSIRDWIDRERPEMIIGQQLVLETIQQEMSWRIPGDVAFAAIEWSPRNPAVAGLNQLQETRGAMSVDLVGAELIQNSLGIPNNPKLLLVEGHWEEGPSAPRRQS